MLGLLARSHELTCELEGLLVVLNEVDHLYVTCLAELEADVVVVAYIVQTGGLLGELVVTLHIVLTFPSAVQGNLEDIVLVGFEVLQQERILVGLDSCRIPLLACLQTGINNES